MLGIPSHLFPLHLSVLNTRWSVRHRVRSRIYMGEQFLERTESCLRKTAECGLPSAELTACVVKRDFLGYTTSRPTAAERSQRARAMRAISKQPKSSCKGTWGVWIKKSGCSAGICRFSSVCLNQSGSRLQASAGISPFLYRISVVQQTQTWTVTPESLWDKG